MIAKDAAVVVDNVSKRYRLGLKEKIEDTMGGAIIKFLKSPLKNYQYYRSLYKFDDESENPDILWALRDVSFEIKQGEVVGIIGRNGAGKSTLLKVISQITPPTRGRVEMRGKISSLLEVGTGFHPELTGRENVYLNGTILGMSKTEVDRKFDEIVDFSGIEMFLDTPVKRYSSGMTVRLAFAVAAHLEPEILIVDEVLAVGDAEFQRKCLNRMQDVGQEGRTVLFVSHNMPAVSRLCQRGILLDGGGVVADGPINEVVGEYLNSGAGTTAYREWPDLSNAPGEEIARLRAVSVRTVAGEITDAVDIRSPLKIEMEYEILQGGAKLLPHFHLFNEEGAQVFSVHDVDPQWRGKARPAGSYRSSVEIPGNLLSEGTLFVSSGLITLDPNIHQFNERDAVAFQVIDSQEGDSARGDWAGPMGGAVRPLLPWQTEYKAR